jgi:hypothetical protein
LASYVLRAASKPVRAPAASAWRREISRHADGIVGPTATTGASVESRSTSTSASSGAGTPMTIRSGFASAIAS